MSGEWPAFPVPLDAEDRGMPFKYYAAVHLLAAISGGQWYSRGDVQHAVEAAGWLCEELEAAAKRESPEAGEA